MQNPDGRFSFPTPSGIRQFSLLVCSFSLACIYFRLDTRKVRIIRFHLLLFSSHKPLIQNSNPLISAIHLRLDRGYRGCVRCTGHLRAWAVYAVRSTPWLSNLRMATLISSNPAERCGTVKAVAGCVWAIGFQPQLYPQYVLFRHPTMDIASKTIINQNF